MFVLLLKPDGQERVFVHSCIKEVGGADIPQIFAYTTRARAKRAYAYDVFGQVAMSSLGLRIAEVQEDFADSVDFDSAYRLTPPGFMGSPSLHMYAITALAVDDTVGLELYSNNTDLFL